MCIPLASSKLYRFVYRRFPSKRMQFLKYFLVCSESKSNHDNGSYTVVTKILVPLRGKCRKIIIILK